MDARDADVLMDDDGRPEQLSPNPSLANDRAVGGACGDDGNDTAGLGHTSRYPDATREHVLLSLRRNLANGAPGCIVRACGQNASGSSVEQRREDARDLLWRLTLREHGFRSTLSKLAMKVDAREAEVAIWELRESLERFVGARLADADALEELAEIVAEPGHRAIVSASRRRYGCDSPARTEQA